MPVCVPVPVPENFRKLGGIFGHGHGHAHGHEDFVFQIIVLISCVRYEVAYSVSLSHSDHGFRPMNLPECASRVISGCRASGTMYLSLTGVAVCEDANSS